MKKISKIINEITYGCVLSLLRWSTLLRVSSLLRLDPDDGPDDGPASAIATTTKLNLQIGNT